MLDILSVSNTYTNSATLSVSQLEQGGALGATDVLVFNKPKYLFRFLYPVQIQIKQRPEAKYI